MKNVLSSRWLLVIALSAYPWIIDLLLFQHYYHVDEPLGKLAALLLCTDAWACLIYAAGPVLWLVALDRSDRFASWIKWSGILAIAALGIIRSSQVVSVVQSRYFLTSDALAHAELIAFTFTWRNSGLFLLAFALPFILILIARNIRPRVVGRLPLWLAPVAVICGSALAYGGFEIGLQRSFFSRYSNQYGLSRHPEVSFFTDFLGFGSAQSEVLVELSEEQVSRLRAMDVLINPSQSLPLLQPHIRGAEIPWAGPKPGKDPDVVVIFVESLSAGLVGCYGSPHEGITPNIDRLATRALKFNEYYNHTTPTITGIHGTLSSIYEIGGNASWESDEMTILANTNTLSLADVLKDRGYETLYLGCGSFHETHIGEIVQRLGFEKTYFKEDIEKKFPESVSTFFEEYPGYAQGGFHNRHYHSDILMLQVLDAVLRQESDKPRLIGVSTIGTHFPYDFGENISYGDGEKPILNSMARLDRSIGLVMETLWQDSGRDIVFVLTADHAMFPTLEYIEVREETFTKAYYDKIACLVTWKGLDHTVDIDTLGSSLDLVPTLLHLLGIDVPNPFMGRSLLSPSPKGRVLFGTQTQFLFAKTKEADSFFSLGDLEHWPGLEYSGLDRPEGRVEPGDVSSLLGYMRFLYRENRIWPD